MELLIYLLQHKKTNYRQLAEHFEVSTKTIERDINSLSGMGIPVYCTQGVGGGVRLEESYKFTTSFFTDLDLRQIIFALKIMDSFSATPKKNDSLKKLCLIAPELSALFQSDAERYLQIDLLSEKLDTANWVCEKIDSCLDQEVLALLDDHLLIAPICYVLKPDGLYLFGFSDSYQMIKCNSIESIELTDIRFEPDFLSYEEYKTTNS